MLVRVDFNVPLENGDVTDDARIRAALPTIELLREKGAALVLCSHLGRPKDREPETSLAPASARLAELLGVPVAQAEDVVGEDAQAKARALEPGQVLVLENTRWEAGETDNDAQLGRDLAVARRRLRERRLRRGPSRPRLHRGGGRAPALGGGAAAGARGHHAARDRGRPRAAAGGGARWSQGVGQGRADRPLPRRRRLDPDRRARCASASSAPRTFRPATRWWTASPMRSRRWRRRPAATPRSYCCPPTWCWARSSTPPPSGSELDGVEVPDGWMGLDVGRETAKAYAAEIAARRHRVLERADGRVRDGALRGRNSSGGRGGGRRRRGPPSWAAATPRPRWRRSGWRRAWTTSPRVAAPPWSCSRARSCPAWRHSRMP